LPTSAGSATSFVRSRVAPTVTACRRYETDAGTRTTDIPDYSHYLTSSSHNNVRTFQYFVVGAFGALTAVAGKATVTDFLATMSASADVLALAKVEVDLNKIPEAKNLIIKYDPPAVNLTPLDGAGRYPAVARPVTNCDVARVYQTSNTGRN
jgi:ubiquinol-cytochrome c reductase iron-sulfur subunit